MITFVLSQKLISRYLATQNFAIYTYSTGHSAWSRVGWEGRKVTFVYMDYLYCEAFSFIDYMFILPLNVNHQCD